MPRSKASDSPHTRPLSLREQRYAEAKAAGMTNAQAANSVGLKASAGISTRAGVKAAIAEHHQRLRSKYKLSRDQCVEGLLAAIETAKLQADPMAQVAGWREIARMLGHYEPERKVIELSDNREEATKQLEAVPMEELMLLAGDSVIDGEFTLVEEESHAH